MCYSVVHKVVSALTSKSTITPRSSQFEAISEHHTLKYELPGLISR